MGELSLKAEADKTLWLLSFRSFHGFDKQVLLTSEMNRCLVADRLVDASGLVHGSRPVKARCGAASPPFFISKAIKVWQEGPLAGDMLNTAMVRFGLNLHSEHFHVGHLWQRERIEIVLALVPYRFNHVQNAYQTVGVSSNSLLIWKTNQPWPCHLISACFVSLAYYANYLHGRGMCVP